MALICCRLYPGGHSNTVRIKKRGRSTSSNCEDSLILKPRVANKVATAATMPLESWQLKVKTISFTPDIVVCFLFLVLSVKIAAKPTGLGYGYSSTGMSESGYKAKMAKSLKSRKRLRARYNRGYIIDSQALWYWP